jgi:GT2 family glycosyltransferase
MKDNCLISIIIPCCNQGQYIDDVLQSVFGQTYKNWECILSVLSVLMDRTEGSYYLDL